MTEKDGLINSLYATVAAQDVEIKRFLALAKANGWSQTRMVSILISHLGTIHAREMNNFLER